jgi:phenylalanyl-tRNA synthetase beta chain
VPELVPRFCLLVIKDIKVGPSPMWLQTCLSRIGIKSINNIVDITNYYTHLSAQPSHAFDYDKVAAKDPDPVLRQLNVRMSKIGEKITLLGGKTIELKEGAFVVSTKTQPIALGGVMGGADTEVDENTKNIILEVGTWDMNTIRRTSMYYGLFTDAATRYTKGQSPLQNRAVIAKMAEDILRFAGGRVCGELLDNNNFRMKL